MKNIGGVTLKNSLVLLTLPSVYSCLLTCHKLNLATRVRNSYSSNNNHVKSNVVASSSSLDSTNDSLSQVTLEQENSLLKGIIDKGVYKSLAGSKQFPEIVRKQGRHRKNQGVGFERKFSANGVEWEGDQ